MSVFTVNKNPSVTDLRKFGWAMLAGFFGIGLIPWYVHITGSDPPSYVAWTGSTPQVIAVCFWGLGALLCVVSLASPALAKPIYVVWMTVAAAIGMVMSTFALTVLFVLFVPLFSVIVRMGDPLGKKRSTGKTYWEDYKPHEPTIERMRRPF